MSNLSIVKRMRELVDGVRAGNAGDGEFERAVEFHMGALEAIDFSAVQQARTLAHRVVLAHLFDGEEEFGEVQDAERAKRDFHAFLDALEIDPK